MNHKIFYGAAIQGAVRRSERAHVNAGIIDAIKSMEFEVMTEHTTGLDFDDTAKKLEKSIGPLPPAGKERTVFIRNKMIQSIESDICAAIFEVSTPSLGTGIEIAHAYLRPRMGLPTIPVIVLYQNGFWPNKLSAMINGISATELPHFHLIEYEALEDIFQQLKPVLKRLKETVTAIQKASGRIVARKCSCCGHHEVGIEKESGEYVPLKPGMNVTLC